jgi:2-polyprenyl-3-methyl-5-hydroxy-6-metoxy-1,4-benzoquinol methylase
MGSSPSYLDPVVLSHIVGSTVLDAGCGIGRWGHLIESNWWESKLDEAPVVDGFDAHEPNVAQCRKFDCYRRVWHQVLPSPIEGQWDTVLASELVEHIPPESALEVLETLEGAARRRIIVTTPNWHYLRPADDSNPFEAHLGSVSRRTLRQRGYKLIGAGIAYRPSRVVAAMRTLRLAWPLESLPRAVPALGDLIVGIKDV